MDELVGILVEQLAKKARAARRPPQTAQPGAAPGGALPRRAAPSPAMARSAAPAGPLPPGTSARVMRAPKVGRPAAMPQAPAQVFAPPAPRAERPPPAPDPFAAVMSAPAAAPTNRLLAAFASANGLLAGIVVGEALAPPLALREREQRRS